MKGAIRKHLASAAKGALPLVPGAVWDGVDAVLGGRDPLTPPLNLRIQVGRLEFLDPRRYQAVGDEYFRYFSELCDLRSADDVLDAGCGCGQMAVPLTQYLDQASRYVGFDIVEPLIHWCRDAISSRFPNFRFDLSDVQNDLYNPGGTVRPDRYMFPYDDGSFDFAFAKSLFTHMLPADMENYLTEIARVLRPDGRCLVSCFLLNDVSLGLIASGASSLDFSHICAGFLTIDPSAPERAIAFDEGSMRDVFHRCGLRLDKTCYGSWCGRKDFLSYQDLLVAHR